MQCVTPMIRMYQDPKLLPTWIQDKIKNKEIKIAQKIVPRSEVLDRLEKNQNLLRHLENRNKELEKSGSFWRYQAIACGHCWACKLKYSAEWATRIMCECKEHEHNYFLTFTYDELNLPIPESSEYDGITYDNPGDWSGTLYPKDIDTFLNSLRKRLERKGHTGIKIFWAGEYCPSSGRPHYHMIIMNCPLDISQFYDFKVDKTTNKLTWHSKELDSLWKKGFLVVGEVEFASAAYVARYCMKKLTDEPNKTIYYSQGKLPEFVRMSRRPGIGAEYYNKNKVGIYKTDEILIRNFHGDICTYKPPKAWDRKFEKEHPEEWERIKQSREAAAKRAATIENELTNITDLDKLERKANNIMTRANMLPRSFEYDY